VSEIKVGDVVEFKSYSPRMVVVKTFKDDDGVDGVVVTWFRESDGEIREDNVAASALVKSADYRRAVLPIKGDIA
jgi:uncharacterized protein YodC (DUF2158 family)